MFGFYRLILALLVASSHHGLIVKGFNPGQWSVICFYLLSGLLMERQFHKLYRQGGTASFYIDRVFRIYPLYLTVVAAGIWITPIPWSAIIANVFLLPQNYATLTKIPSVITTAW